MHVVRSNFHHDVVDLIRTRIGPESTNLYHSNWGVSERAQIPTWLKISIIMTSTRYFNSNALREGDGFEERRAGTYIYVCIVRMYIHTSTANYLTRFFIS